MPFPLTQLAKARHISHIWFKTDGGSVDSSWASAKQRSKNTDCKQPDTQTLASGQSRRVIMTSPSPLLLLCILPWIGTLTNHIPIYHEAMRNYSTHDAVIAAHMNESFTPHKHVIQALLISSFFLPSEEAEAQNVSPISKRLVLPPP